MKRNGKDQRVGWKKIAKITFFDQGSSYERGTSLSEGKKKASNNRESPEYRKIAVVISSNRTRISFPRGKRLERYAATR